MVLIMAVVITFVADGIAIGSTVYILFIYFILY